MNFTPLSPPQKNLPSPACGGPCPWTAALSSLLVRAVCVLGVWGGSRQRFQPPPACLHVLAARWSCRNDNLHEPATLTPPGGVDESNNLLLYRLTGLRAALGCCVPRFVAPLLAPCVRGVFCCAVACAAPRAGPEAPTSTTPPQSVSLKLSLTAPPSLSLAAPPHPLSPPICFRSCALLSAAAILVEK